LSKFLHSSIIQSSNSVPVTLLLNPTPPHQKPIQINQNALHNLPHHPRPLHRRSRPRQFVPHPTSPLPLLFHLTNTTPIAPQTNPDSDVASILEALRENNPEDADAAASAMKIKLRRRDPVVGDDLASILAALEANNPEDAAAAKTLGKRQDDVKSILAQLEANNPEDAQAAREAGF
jgi:hypothetical protein